MEEQFIPISKICRYHKIDVVFLQSLHEYDLIDFFTVQETSCIAADQLPEIESLIRLHYELKINLEGIDAIRHLQKKMVRMQTEMKLLRDRLKLYEG